ncbi:MAG: MmcB family DNA repair protein [Rhodospirillales bacterium]
MPDDRAMTPTALALARGLGRHLAEAGYSTLTELILPNGRRVDVIGIDRAGTIAVVEIKTSVADFRGDEKWPEYREYCDRFYFAVPEGFPIELVPAPCGLFVADAYGAAMLRDSDEVAVNAARRRALLLRFASIAADRLRGVTDPGV